MREALSYDQPIRVPVNPARSGFAAVASVLVIGVVIVVLGTSVTLLSINGLQGSFSYRQGAQTRFLADSCVEEALLVINETESLPTSLTTPEGTCDLTLDAQVGDAWEFTVESNFEGNVAVHSVEADRGSVVSVTEWMEE
ncbi:hypothetical protein LRY65_01930 [Candidatus Woesebacteria bacterium]|nr:hypothetical protein [Candidatus Woesebacteria bacterium]MCD8507496.1 hypothetical protein [Candidatus Woesebacteria bacterium]MCD8526951.1 hypothetical protein [Candidatus Woesebacteria bacterium]MCD8545850.1 hypothetical protein [Candidatus Woesebacteria bacterium]